MTGHMILLGKLKACEKGAMADFALKSNLSCAILMNNIATLDSVFPHARIICSHSFKPYKKNSSQNSHLPPNNQKRSEKN